MEPFRIEGWCNWSSCFFAVAIFLFYRGQRRIGSLIEGRINGKIIKFKDLGKTSYEVWVYSKDTSYVIVGFAIYKNKILIGDSLSKAENSNQIFYYKLNIEGEYYLFDIFHIYPSAF